MLLSRLNQNIVAIGASSIRLIRQRYGKRHRDVLQHLAVRWNEDNDCDRLILALEQLLREHGEVKRITVVLQDNVVAYATLPWADIALKRAEADDLASIRMQEIYGAAVSNSVIRSWQDFGRRGIACAVPHNLAQKIEELGGRTGVSILDIRPAISEVLSRARIPRTQKRWLAVDRSPDGCLLAVYEQNGWTSVRYVRYSEVPTASLFDLVARECLLIGIDDEASIFLCDDTSVRCTTLASFKETLSNV